MSRIVLGHVKPTPLPGDGRVVLRPAPSKGGGRMPVIMSIYGGDAGLAECMEGLVQRNERSIRERAVPSVRNSGLTPDFRPGQNGFDSPQCWRDAVSALTDRKCSIGTMVAYRAAEQRAANKPAYIGFVGGLPTVAYVENGQVMGYDAPLVSVSGPDALAAPRPDEVHEYMQLTLDDDKAMPVREINTAIGRHNAHQIKERGLPSLYGGSIRYETEGSPELWWDAQKIANEGHDDCFAASTTFLTYEGLRRLGDVVGTRQIVLTREGVWAPADILSGRVQQLFALTLARDGEAPGGETRVELPTREHKWFVLGASEKKTTDALTPGDQLVVQRGSPWTVVSTVPTDRVEEVFCAVVPGSGSFTLADDLVTSNCEGLAAYRVGELINEAQERDLDWQPSVYCRLIQNPNKRGGGRLFHAVTEVRDSSGRLLGFDDPSVNMGHHVPGGGMPVPSWYASFCRQRRAEGREL